MQIFSAKFQEKKNPEGDLRTDKSKNGEGQQCESIWEHFHWLYLTALPLLPFSLWEKVNVFSQKQRRFAGSWNVCLHIPSRPAFRNICCNICSAGFLIKLVLFFSSFFVLFCRSRLSRTVRYSQEKKFAASLWAKLIVLTGLNRLENQEHFVFLFFHEHQYIWLLGFRCNHWSSGVGKIFIFVGITFMKKSTFKRDKRINEFNKINWNFFFNSKMIMM